MSSSISNLKLRAGHAEVALNAGRAELLAAIEQSNGKMRLQGLPDRLNPEIIDPEKTEAMVAALPRLPEETLRSLGGKTLYLNYPGLMIGTSAPTRATSFAQPFKLEIADLQGEVVLARLILRVDCPLARERAAEARTRFKSAEDEVKALETRLSAGSGNVDKEREVLPALSMARRSRFAVARVWQQNAEACTHCPGADNAAEADLEAASQAVKSSVVLSGGGMP